MNKKLIILILLSFVLSLAVVGCKNKPVAMQGPSQNKNLIVLENAMSIYNSNFKGQDSIAYNVQAKFPANSVIEEISNRLKAMGWEPLKKSFLNPEIDTSFIRGWTGYVDAVNKSQLKYIFSWSGEWMDKDKNLVSYSFRYTDPFVPYTKENFKKTPSSEIMYVSAYYQPAAFAAKQLEWAKSMNKEQKKK